MDSEGRGTGYEGGPRVRGASEDERATLAPVGVYSTDGGAFTLLSGRSGQLLIIPILRSLHLPPISSAFLAPSRARRHPMTVRVFPLPLLFLCIMFSLRTMKGPSMGGFCLVGCTVCIVYILFSNPWSEVDICRVELHKTVR